MQVKCLACYVALQDGRVTGARMLSCGSSLASVDKLYELTFFSLGHVLCAECSRQVRAAERGCPMTCDSTFQPHLPLTLKFEELDSGANKVALAER